MTEGFRVTRRGLLGASLSLGAVDLMGCASAEAAAPPPSGFSLLAPSYSIAARIPDDGNDYFIHDPGMALLPSGNILVAAPLWQLSPVDAQANSPIATQTLVSRSSDGGVTWQSLPALPYSDAVPFVQNGVLYMFVWKKQFVGLTTFGTLSISASSDEGATWAQPVELFPDTWNNSTGMVRQDGKLYWAVQSAGWQGVVSVIAADTTKDLLDPATWQKSTGAAHPGTPLGLVAGGACKSAPTDCSGDWWLEPNIVSVGGNVRVILRTILDQYRTTSLPVVCDLTSGADGMSVAFTQFFPAPGGQGKCFILWDDTSKLFWMLSNLAADSQSRILDWSKVYAEKHFYAGPGNDRRTLLLSYSLDALNWFPAGYVAKAALLRQSYMYPSAAVDGDDLILISRTSVNGPDQHNADLVTFHRVPKFRSLALDLYADE
jgi:hypothetical protein